jgi:alpha-methylacyl-CoA racemase
MAGPLAGLRIIELAGKGPGPFCGMMLADHGARVIRVERPGVEVDVHDPLVRSRDSIVVNLKAPDGVTLVRNLAKWADGLIEGYRPGVLERLGLGPEVLLADNPKLIYGRMTGWGQTGPYAHTAGHDINYIALSGTLHGIGRAGEKPTAPGALVGDFGGGGMMLAFGMLCGLLAVQRGGQGQVIDCAMTDGTALLSAMTWGYYATGEWRDERGVNMLDSGAHFYDTYECADGKFISIGAIEPEFYALLRSKLSLTDDSRFDAQLDPSQWGALKQALTTLFLSRTRTQWCELLELTDVCFAPVLSLAEAPRHPHNVARETFIRMGNGIQPAPAPRYSHTINDRPSAFRSMGAAADALLAEMGYEAGEIERLRENAVLG